MVSPIIVSDYISEMSFPKAIEMMILDVTIITLVSIVTVYFLVTKYLSSKRYVSFFIGLFSLLLAQSFLYYLGYIIIWSMKVPNSLLEFIADEIISGGQSFGVLAGILLAKKYFEIGSRNKNQRASSSSIPSKSALLFESKEFPDACVECLITQRVLLLRDENRTDQQKS